MTDQPKLLHRILMPDDARLMSCPFCGREAIMEGTFALGERRFFVRCLYCHCTSRIAVSEVDALNDWNRRDGLLPALRVVRERCIQIIRDDMGVPVFAGAAATWIWRRLNDAALLELAGGDPSKEKEARPLEGPAIGGQDQPTSPSPASSFCSQCGQDLSAPACGPTHALMALELAGVTQVPVVPIGSPGAESSASSLPYAEYAPPMKSAAEPAERPLMGSWKEIVVEMAEFQRMALQDAARDLREWADSGEWGSTTYQWPGGEPLGALRALIRKCADRLEVRAKELVAK